jgi:hypothetical protein
MIIILRSLRRIVHSSRGVLQTVARRGVWSRNLENEEAKARYRAVENTTTMDCNARKTNIMLCYFTAEFHILYPNIIIM